MKLTIIKFKFYCALFDFWFKIAQYVNKELDKINSKCHKIADSIITYKNDQNKSR